MEIEEVIEKSAKLFLSDALTQTSFIPYGKPFSEFMEEEIIFYVKGLRIYLNKDGANINSYNSIYLKKLSGCIPSDFFIDILIKNTDDSSIRDEVLNTYQHNKERLIYGIFLNRKFSHDEMKIIDNFTPAISSTIFNLNECLKRVEDIIIGPSIWKYLVLQVDLVNKFNYIVDRYQRIKDCKSTSFPIYEDDVELAKSRLVMDLNYLTLNLASGSFEKKLSRNFIQEKK